MLPQSEMANRNRKIRRNVRKILKHGQKAAPRHKCKSGRTGGAHSKKLKSLHQHRLTLPVSRPARSSPPMLACGPCDKGASIRMLLGSEFVAEPDRGTERAETATVTHRPVTGSSRMNVWRKW